MPVTATGRVNVTSTSIRSPSTYVLSPVAGVLNTATPLADATVNVPPATLWFVLFEIASTPSPRSASVVPPASLIAPPFNANALDSMLMPSASASAITTKYRKTSDMLPVPEA